MDTQRYTFVREGLDDFRIGCPPADNLIIHGPRDSFLPTIAHRVPQPPPRKTQKKLLKGSELLSRPPPQKTQKKLPKGAELLSKLSPAQQTQKAFIEEIEANLTQHPLACDPDMKDLAQIWPVTQTLPSDVLLKVLEELDPDKKMEDTWAYSEDMRDREKFPTQLCTKGPDEVNLGPPNQVTPGPPGQVNQGPPDQVTSGPPDQVTSGPPDQVNPGPPEQVNQGTPDQVNQGPLRESFLSCLMKLFLKENKKKKLSQKGIPKGGRRKEEDIL